MVTSATNLDQAIDEFIQSLKKAIPLEAVILYGSYVNGIPDEWSDIDLAVISPGFEDMRFALRQELLAKVAVRCNALLSPIGYPSSEYHNRGPQSFLEEIIRTGRVVYPK